MRHAAQLVQSVPFRWLIVLLAVLVAAFYSLESVDACDVASNFLQTWEDGFYTSDDAVRAF